MDLARSCLKMTADLLEEFRFRVAGTDPCRAAARRIADRFRQVCDSVREDPFTLHPRALWFVGKAIALVYAAAAFLWFLGGPLVYVAAALCILGCAYAVSQYVLYGRMFDPFFKAAEGLNIIGEMEPVEKADRQIVLVGHHDSPCIFSFLERGPKLAFVRLLLAILAYAALSLGVLIAAFSLLLADAPVACEGALFWLTLAGLPLAFQLFFLMSSQSSPGAGDDLNAVSMAREIAGHFRRESEEGRGLRRTRLILLSTDGEEIGQRGAIHYVEKYRSQLAALPVRVLNIDSVYFLKDLAVLTRDRNFSCPLSPSMVSDIRAVAHDRGVALKKIALPFGGGGTDAAAFARAGFEATTLLGQPVTLVSGDHLYHTSRDTVDGLEPAAVEAVLDLAISYIRLIDDMSSPDPQMPASSRAAS